MFSSVFYDINLAVKNLFLIKIHYIYKYDK